MMRNAQELALLLFVFQSVPVSSLTSHHMKTSTPNSSVHSLTGNHNTAGKDHEPLLSYLYLNKKLKTYFGSLKIIVIIPVL